MTSSSSQTIAGCASSCAAQGFAYFGTEYGSECWWVLSFRLTRNPLKFVQVWLRYSCRSFYSTEFRLFDALLRQMYVQHRFIYLELAIDLHFSFKRAIFVAMAIGCLFTDSEYRHLRLQRLPLRRHQHHLALRQPAPAYRTHPSVATMTRPMREY